MKGLGTMGAKCLAVMITIALTNGVCRAQSASLLDAAVEKRVDALMGQMTVDEKISLLSGTGFGVRSIPRLGIPGVKMTDGPYGVRDGWSTVLPAGIGLAATWNPDLARRAGEVIGQDARARGSHFQLGPGVNIYRAPQNGRNFEYFGEDPYLASRIAVGYIQGVQSKGVSAVIKHFAGNNSEYVRNYTDAVIDERALREIYLPIFEAAVKQAPVGAVMDSYNLVNGSYMSANRHLNIDVLKQDWEFHGVLMSDWASTHEKLATINNGLDLEMPRGVAMDHQTVLNALKDGKTSLANIDAKVRRILRTEVSFGWLDRPQLDNSLPLLNEAGRALSREIARESVVLLKNEGKVLPLSRERTKSVAVIGPLAYPGAAVGGGSAQATPFETVSLLAGMSHALGTEIPVLYSRGLPTYARVVADTKFSRDAAAKLPGLKMERFDNLQLQGNAVSTVAEHLNIGQALDLAAADEGEASLNCCRRTGDVSYRWSGFYTPETPGAYQIVIFQSGGGEKTGYRVHVDGKIVMDRWAFPRAIVETNSLDLEPGPHEIVVEFWSGRSFALPLFRVGIRRAGTWVDAATLALAAKADFVILSVGFDPTTEFEGWDRSFDLPPGQQELIEKIATVNPHVVVVLQGGGNVAMNAWIPRVPALLHAWYPGEEGGAAIADILTGVVSPSGHLPATFERKPEDNPTFGNYYPDPGDASTTPRVTYKEGIFVGYRGYEHNHVTPMFPFGFGLSYTTFKYANLKIEPTVEGPDAALYSVSFDVTNTGQFAGKVVPQLYVAPPKGYVERAPKELKGFAKVELVAGEKRHITLYLDKRSFTYFDTQREMWLAPVGTYTIAVGSSSETMELSAPLQLQATLEEKR